MKYKRKFAIKIKYINSANNLEVYVKEINKISIGFFHTITHKIENAKTWRYKKTCENSLEMLLNKPDPTKNTNIKNCEFTVVEITDNQVLRNIKLSKIKKDEI